MPPRSQNWQDGAQSPDTPCNSTAQTLKKAVRQNFSHSVSSHQHRWIIFRAGPLRFGFHGVMGIVSLLLTTIALYQSYIGKADPTSIVYDNSSNVGTAVSIGVFISTSAVSIGSYGLLSQVPLTSHISSWIFPPHRNAFERTIAIVGYLNLRLSHRWSWWTNIFCFVRRHSFKWFEWSESDCKNNSFENLVFASILLLYTNYHFFPFKADLKNGNTWVFVLPMWIGFSIDAIHQIPKLVVLKQTEARVSSIWNGGLYGDGEDSLLSLDWNSVWEWRKSKVDETYLLMTLWCALQIAFMFTIAFRGKMNIRTCYWIAAAEVGLLCVGLLQ